MFGLKDKDARRTAAVSETGEKLLYGDLFRFQEIYRQWIPERTLIFILCRNEAGALQGYVSSLCSGIVPLLLDGELDRGLLDDLIHTYEPEYLWIPAERKSEFTYEVWGEAYDYILLKTGYGRCRLNSELALLLTTSGSTGTVKLVRQSYRNIMSNAEAIREYLELDDTERPITNLPMSYTYGLSVINSHLLAGATVLLTSKSIFEKEFWTFFKEQKATSMAGVPYTYEMLKKLRFFRMELPSLRTLTQSGGKLPLDLHREFAQYAEEKGIRFYVMYGQTEATARMSYLPMEKAVEKCGSMGIAIRGGKFSLIDGEGVEIKQSGVVGELVYEGENVTLGYAERREDLAEGDVWHGRILTGDMAKRDEDGYYYIVGRKKRFLKIFGKRVNLDECEALIRREFATECACGGQDDLLCVYIVDKSLEDPVRSYLSEIMKFHHSAFRVTILDEIPKNKSGKIQYRELPL